MLHCDLRMRWKVASDLRFRAAISEPQTPSFCGISGDLAPSTRKSLAIAIMRFSGRPRFGSVRLRFGGGTVRVPVPLWVPGKTVPTVPVPGSGSVPEPPWILVR